MNAAEAAERTRERVAAALEGVDHRFAPVLDGMACVEADPRTVRAVLERLRHRAEFEQVTFVTAVDWYPETPRFEVDWQLRSYRHDGRVRVKSRLASDALEVPTCIDLWPGAAFMERECFDLFGILFTGHEGLKRLMMPEDYVHHPLRKDFPHQGIQPDRLYREWDRKRREDYRRRGIDLGEGNGRR